MINNNDISGTITISGGGNALENTLFTKSTGLDVTFQNIQIGGLDVTFNNIQIGELVCGPVELNFVDFNIFDGNLHNNDIIGNVEYLVLSSQEDPHA